MNCHPDRSAAQWRACPERSRMGTCCSLHQPPDALGSIRRPLCHPEKSHKLSGLQRFVSVIERNRQAIFTRERRPGRGTLLTILLAISSEAVAAGEGALHTWR